MSEASGKSGCKVYFGGLTEATGITTEETFKALLKKEDVTLQWLLKTILCGNSNSLISISKTWDC